MSDARGLALIAVLWVVVALSGLTAAALSGAGAASAAERAGALQARWAAEACLAAAEERLADDLRANAVPGPPAGLELRFANGAACTVEAYDTGGRINADSLGGTARARFDSVVAALGLTVAAQQQLLTRAGDGRINLNAAGAAVLSIVPGFGPEAVREVLELRRWGRPLGALDDVIPRLSPPARTALLARYNEAASRVTVRASTLVFTARGGSAVGRGAVIEQVVVPAGQRVAIVGRRLW